MKLTQALLALLFSAPLVSVALAADTPPPNDDDCDCGDAPKIEAYRLRILSRATSHSCGQDEQFKHSMVLCSPYGCVSHDVTNASRLTFRAGSGDHIKVSSQSSYTDNGAAQGDSETTEHSAGFQGRFTQTVQARGKCLRSVVFEVSAVPR